MNETHLEYWSLALSAYPDPLSCQSLVSGGFPLYTPGDASRSLLEYLPADEANSE